MWPHDCGKCGSGDFCQLVITDVDSKAGLWVTVFLGTFLLPYFSFVQAHISFMPWTNYVVNCGKLASILFGFKMSSVVFLLVSVFGFLMKNWGSIAVFYLERGSDESASGSLMTDSLAAPSSFSLFRHHLHSRTHYRHTRTIHIGKAASDLVQNQTLDNWLCSLYGFVTFGLCSLFTYAEGLFCLLHWIGASLLALLLV